MSVFEVLEKKGIKKEEYEKTLLAIQMLPSELNSKLRYLARNMITVMSYVHPEDTALFYEFCRRQGLELGKDFLFYYIDEEDHHMDLCIRRGLEHIGKAFEEFLSEVTKYETAMFLLRSVGITEPTKKQLETAFKIIEFQKAPCKLCYSKPLELKEFSPFRILKRALEILPTEISYDYGEKTIIVTIKYGCGHKETKKFEFKEE